ncbi:MAG: acetate--CoA ligase family protein [Methylobacterium frigidaeris]
MKASGPEPRGASAQTGDGNQRRPALARLLAPRSVAIVGASDKPGALGASVLANLERFGFSGDIHLVNPKRDRIGGRPCVASVADLPRGIDAAVLAIPGPAVLDAVRALAERGAGAAVIFAAGFAEGGDEGRAAQAEIARIARETGMVIEGPNCLGLTNYAAGVPLTFVASAPQAVPAAGGVGIVSQSGAMAVVLGTMLSAKGLPLTLSVSTGNEAASGVEDYVEHLVDDPGTRVIAMVVEQFRAPRRFLAAAERARAAGKPVVLLHPGRSSAARESAATHTGAMAGDWALMRAKVAQAGVVVADGLEMLADVVDIAFRCGPVPAGGTAVLTESGAFKALALDLAEAIGLDLPAVGPEAGAALRAAMPDFIPVSNPLDLTAQTLVDPDLYRRALAAILADPGFGSVVLGIIQTDPATAAQKFPPITAALRGLGVTKPVLFAGLDEGAAVPQDAIDDLRALGVPYFPAPDRAFRALAALRADAGTAAEAVAPIALALPAAAGMIPEYRAKALLAPAGLPFPPGAFAADPEEARAAAARLGYPVALKAQAAALPHKSDAGGVALGIADAAALERAWSEMQAAVARHAPGLVLDGVLVEAMGRRGTELIVGARNDPDWGAVILVGFGGVQAEILKDVRLLPAGLSRAAIAAELRALRAGALLDGWRGTPALDVEAVVDLVVLLGRVLAGTPAIREIDLNPVVVHPVGEGVVALDALILADQG